MKEEIVNKLEQLEDVRVIQGKVSGLLSSKKNKTGVRQDSFEKVTEGLQEIATQLLGELGLLYEKSIKKANSNG